MRIWLGRIVMSKKLDFRNGNLTGILATMQYKFLAAFSKQLTQLKKDVKKN